MKTVIILGTSHSYQLPENPAAGVFGRFLSKACVASRVCAIAEEMSLEGLGQKDASESLCKRLADRAGLSHRYCDPNNEQRAALRIRDETAIKLEAWRGNWPETRKESEIRTSHGIREKYWLDQLGILDTWPVLFVCGANHVEPFARLLEGSGFGVDVVAQDWSPPRRRHRRKPAASAHPPCGGASS